ncbi:hypothetical protein BGZ60DRAFT_364780 [Tricladium varicosporioides]|nr:hypothetical protein BGZ60DRAFT_364780 [Hymenoscyphus varicosporioides]
MTEAENFEEDLFADLYTEDDAIPKTEVVETKAEIQPVVGMKMEDPVEHNEQNGNGDTQAYKDEQDMEDEIDFNLGNGTSYDSPANHEAHGPGIKEDG